MSIDDLEPTKKPANAWKNLEDMSIDALHAYITELEREIERVRAAILKAKKRHARGAEQFFKR